MSSKHFNIDKIRKLFTDRRERLRLTQGDLAQRIGFPEGSRAIIHRIEQGTRNITLEEYVDLCHALRIDAWRPLKDRQIVIPVTSSDYEAELQFMLDRIKSLEAENKRLQRDLQDNQVAA